MIDTKGREKFIADKKKQQEEQSFLKSISYIVSQSIQSAISRLQDTFPTKKDVTDLNKSIKQIPTPPSTVSIQNKQVESLLTALRSIKTPSFPEYPKSVTVGNLNLLIDEVRELSAQLEILQDSVPDTYKVSGDVTVKNLPPPVDLTPLLKELQKTREHISSLNKDKLQRPNPKTPESDLEPLLQELIDAIDNLANKEQPYFPESINIGNFPPQYIPPTVTNININSLNGVLKSTQIAVGGTATLLPAQNLPNRRTLVIYNNSSQTIYIGGSTVAASGTGIGLPVLKNQYSPPIDAGQNMNVYGIVATGTANAIVLEASNESDGR